MQKTLYIILFSLFTIGLHANNLKLDIQKALEISADQQVQSQRIARIYLALCNNLMEPTLYQERDAAIELFDEQMHQLSLFTPNDDIKDNIQNVRAIWQEYKKIASWSIKKDAASKLLKQSTSILQATKALHAAYYNYNKSLTTPSENSDLITIKQYIKQLLIRLQHAHVSIVAIACTLLSARQCDISVPFYYVYLYWHVITCVEIRSVTHL